MKQKRILLITIIALIVLVSTVNAETLTGTLGGNNWTQTSIGTGGSTTGTNAYFSLYAKTIQSAGTPASIIQWIWTGKRIGVDTGAPTGSSTSCIFYIYNGSYNGTTKLPLESIGTLSRVGTGTIGYQRVFDTAIPPVEQNGAYAYVVFNNDWNATAAGTGNKYIFIDYNRNSVYNMSITAWGATINQPAGTIGFNVDGTLLPWSTDMLYSKQDPISATYSFTKPSGLGIQGNITKTAGLSQGFVWNSAGTTVLTSDVTASSSPLELNTVSDSILVGIKDSAGNYYNSTILFYPTATPTPTPTIPAGYTRTYFTCLDGQTNGVIQDVNIQLKDVEGATWTNYTSDWDGTGYIDTLPSHTINAYADAVGYTATERLGLNAFSGSYPLIMYGTGIFPPTGDGNVNLVVMVTDDMTQQPLASVELAAYYPNGSSLGGVTGSLGQEVFIVKNDTVMRVAATKPGYIDKTGIITTSHIGPDYLRINLDRETITPTPTRTVVPGEVTVRPTVDPNSPEQNNGDTSLKAQEMMNFIANNGLTLVELCFMVTIFALLGVKFGK